MRFWIPCVSFLLVAPVLAADAPPPGKALDRIVAIVNSQAILQSELREASDRFAAEMKAKNFADRLGTPAETDRRVLDQLINDRLVQAEIQRLGLTATDAVVDGAVASVMRQNGMTTQTELIRALKAEGMTLEEYRASVRKQIENSRYINETIRPRIQVSDQDVEAAWKRENAESADRRLVKVRMIYKRRTRKGGERKVLDRLRRQIEAGVPFDRVADRETEGPGKGEGGAIGLVNPDDMQPELGRVLGNLEPGKLSPVIETKEGFYLLLCLERVKGEPPPLTEEAKAKMKEKLTLRQTEQQFDALVRELRAKAQVEVLL